MAPDALVPEPERGDETVADVPAAAPRMASADPSAGVLVGRFELVRELGRGALGVVYEARDRELGRVVALKTMRRDRSDRPVDAVVRREAEAVARLQHENIVTLYEMGRADSGPYLVFELLRGETLASRLERGPMPAAEALHVAVQIARALVHSHALGILHRDLKPANVFLTKTGAVKVMDFGLAYVFGEPTAVCGTPAYMPPEQWRGDALDARTDLFALGVTLYEALAGDRPYAVRGGRSLVMEDSPPPTLDAIPARLQLLVGQMIARDPGRRPRTAAAVLEGLLAIERAGTPPSRRRARAIAGVVLVAALAAAGLTGARSCSPHATVPVTPSIAVLPFADFSVEGDQGYFSDGVAEEILNALTHVEGLKVAGRTSSFSFRGAREDLRSIGHKLGVATVLEGSIRKEANRVRVTAQLISVADGYHLWSAEYDRELTGILAVQDEIARAVVGALRVRLLPRGTGSERRAIDAEAYGEYLLGRQQYRRYTADGFRGAIASFERATRRDPSYAPAWTGLARALFMLSGFDADADAAQVAGMRQRAREATDRAIALAPDDADAYSVRATARASFDWDWSRAEEDAGRALALAPRDVNVLRAFGVVSFYLGRNEAAVGALREVIRLDPLVSASWNNVGLVYLSMGDHAAARRHFQRALEIAPGAEWLAFALGEVSLFEGDPASALTTFQKEKDARYRLVGAALAHHNLGHREQSVRALDELIEKFGAMEPFLIACVHAWRGERDVAFEWIERAFARRDNRLSAIQSERLVASLRKDPRYAALLVRMGFPRG